MLCQLKEESNYHNFNDMNVCQKYIKLINIISTNKFLPNLNFIAIIFLDKLMVIFSQTKKSYTAEAEFDLSQKSSTVCIRSVYTVFDI